MSNENQMNPLDSVKQISEMWEKGLNGLLFQSINNNQLIQMTKFGIDAHSRYIEMLKRNREMMASYMNLPTKTDVANVAKLSIQAEEKIDILEEQIWNLQESFELANKENQRILIEMMEYTKQIHSEWLKASEGLAQLSDIKKEFESMKKLLKKEKVKEEPVLASAGTTK
ncbi:polyhydroxyalkanoate biosynthesis repressor PhaR [Neobacillus sp. FSL H8-0543]|uniref:polyhydroxyalkanoate biosynthesis repressor PhaR n=1 Tax=Neobacillus sp. FSL H8-0543 TaxID=2954672 RepID=UPI00315886F6